MRASFCAVVALGLWASVCAAQCKPDPALLAKSAAILERLDSLPHGIDVVHDPAAAKARLWDHKPYNFQWAYATQVAASTGAVTVLEFGSFVWSDDRWVFANYSGEPFSATDFSEWYSCPGAELVEGKTFVDPHNWTGGADLRPGRMMWYYIGTDQQGRQVKGTSVVQTLAEVVKEP
ncbi:MAG: hypothetical protein R6X35_09565 [Candidatus Krumholzibacteriia bacterium]